MADLFGFHALQLGLPELDALRANRMPHRWLAVESVHDAEARRTAGRRRDEPSPTQSPSVAVPPPSLHCDFDALPFDAASLDLVVLPHALELARDPHLTLREVERVLVPEGRVVIVGFNPASLWGTAPAARAPAPAAGLAQPGELFLPRAGEFIGYRRLRDWLRLLSFEVEAGRFGCYLPPLHVGALARPLRLDGARRRALVAGVRRGLLHRRGQAGARHAPGRPDPQGRAPEGRHRACAGGHHAAARAAATVESDETESIIGR